MGSNKDNNSGNADNNRRSPINSWGGNIDLPEDHQSLSEWDRNLWTVLKRMEAVPADNISVLKKNNSTKKSYNSQYTEIEKALFNLPLMYREVLDLYDSQAFSLKEIAEIIGTDISGAKWRIIAARKQFRKQLPQFFKPNNEQLSQALINENSDLPIDLEIAALIKKLSTPELSDSSSNRLSQAYRAQLAPARAQVAPVPTSVFDLDRLKAKVLTFFYSLNAPMPMAAALIVLISTIGVSYWIFKKPNLSNGLGMSAVKNSPVPTPQHSPTIKLPNVSPTPGLPDDEQAQKPIEKPIQKGGVSPKHQQNLPDLPVMPPIERGNNATSLATIKTLYVNQLGDSAINQQLRAVLIEKLIATGRWRVLDDSDIDQADAVFEISPQDSNTILLVNNGKVIWKMKIDISTNRSINRTADAIITSLQNGSN